MFDWLISLILAKRAVCGLQPAALRNFFACVPILPSLFYFFPARNVQSARGTLRDQPCRVVLSGLERRRLEHGDWVSKQKLARLCLGDLFYLLSTGQDADSLVDLERHILVDQRLDVSFDFVGEVKTNGALAPTDTARILLAHCFAQVALECLLLRGHRVDDNLELGYLGGLLFDLTFERVAFPLNIG